jgi:uncharacterized protein with GYD domain
MKTYIAISPTRGLRSVKDTTKRADAVMELAVKLAPARHQLLLTSGQYDLVAVDRSRGRRNPPTPSVLSIALPAIHAEMLRAFSGRHERHSGQDGLSTLAGRQNPVLCIKKPLRMSSKPFFILMIIVKSLFLHRPAGPFT